MALLAIAAAAPSPVRIRFESEVVTHQGAEGLTAPRPRGARRQSDVGEAAIVSTTRAMNNASKSYPRDDGRSVAGGTAAAVTAAAASACAFRRRIRNPIAPAGTANVNVHGP